MASGKGGAGKTSIAVSLVLASSEGTMLVDCDVEEPNAALLLEPEILETEPATIPVPNVDESKCTYCKECSKACRFHAIMILPHKAVVFEKMCHGCGVCSFVCPESAITERPREMGEIIVGRKGEVLFVEGRLQVGEAMAPPLIRQVKAKVNQMVKGREELVVLDAPPGVSCPFVETAKGSDAIIFVVEPTPFGYHDFELSSRVVVELGMPWGVVVNKEGIGGSGAMVERTIDLCKSRGGKLLGRIPFREEIARAYSKGIPLVETAPELRPVFQEILQNTREMVNERVA